MQCIIQKQDRRVFKLVSLLAAFLCMRAATAAPFILDIEREIQLTDQTCWAAVSVMALRAFKDEGVEQYSQRDLILFHEADVEEPADLRDPEIKATLKILREEDCRDDLALCSSLGEAYVLGLHSDTLPHGKALTPAHFKKEIVVRKRPVIIQWDYRGTDPRDDSTPKIKHYLIVIGYDDSTAEPRLRIWNPWPTASLEQKIRAAGGAPVVREEWIPYSRYLNPGDGVKARHEADEYKLRETMLSMLLGRYPSLATIDSRGRVISAGLRRAGSGGGR